MIRHPKLRVLIPGPSQPSPRQLPERKQRMTVGLGLLSPIGIVIASDSLESTQAGYSKGNVQKVFIEPVPGGLLYVAAAGTASPCDYIVQEVREALNAQKRWDLQKYIAVIRSTVRTYYKDYVWPSKQRSELAAIFGLWGGANNGALLKTDQDPT